MRANSGCSPHSYIGCGLDLLNKHQVKEVMMAQFFYYYSLIKDEAGDSISE